MQELTSNKYITILEAENGQLEDLIYISQTDHWKPIFHIHPECGLLNDPNGLSYFNGEYHVFYQWFPFAPIHGMKHWAHVKSKDLVHWERMPVAIIPTEDYEAQGAYSGSAIVKDDKLLLYYTGNLKYQNGERDANQCLAIMDKDYKTSKSLSNPIIKSVPAGYTGHVRDPKVWEDAGMYYMILGAQKKNLTGALLIYQSIDGIEWNVKGELKVSLDNFGYMWECPDYFNLQGKDILVFSPQGIEKKGYEYQNRYNAIYAVGKMDINELIFSIEYIKELDKGFDFYAPQSFEDHFGRRIMMGWAGTGETQYPSDRNQWAHCLTLPRELIFEDNILKQRPVSELVQLRNRCISMKGVINGSSTEVENRNNSYEINAEFTELQSPDIVLKILKSESEGFTIYFDVFNNVVSLDRENFSENVKDGFGYVRTAQLTINDKVAVRIFVDGSIVEVFINNGEMVFTSRVFPKETITGIEISGTGKFSYHVDKYTIKRGI